MWKRQEKKTPMEEIRKAAIEDVNKRVESGELKSVADVRKLIKHPRSAAEQRYDEELLGDGAFPKPGQHWVTAADIKDQAGDKADLAACSIAIDIELGGEAAAAKEIMRITKKIDKIIATQRQCVALGVPGCKYLLDRHRVELERGKACMDAKVLNYDLFAMLSDKLRRKAMEHKKKRDIAREKNAKAKRAKNRLSIKKGLAKRNAVIVKADKTARKLALLKMAHQYTPMQLGDSTLGKKSYLSKQSLMNRMDCLERVRLMSPKLPYSDDLMWPHVLLAYCTACRNLWQRSTGTKFSGRINCLVHELGTHYGGCDRVNKARTVQDKAYLLKYQLKPVNNKSAFYDFYKEMQRWQPKSLTCCPT